MASRTDCRKKYWTKDDAAEEYGYDDAVSVISLYFSNNFRYKRSTRCLIRRGISFL